jgi:dipeptidyl aminopeptidase/acylaminoacyl peptidase
MKRCVVLVCATLAGAIPAHLAPGQTGPRIHEPLPLAATAALRLHNYRSPVNISPDGLWIAHTVQTPDTIPRESSRFTATGVSLAEGNRRRDATLTHTRTGEVVRLGSETSSSWAPVWSPDAQRVAFYSDEGGEAGLWIWDARTRRSTQLGDVIVRPAFGFEVPRWSPDGDRVLVKLLPEGMSVADANALGGRSPQAPGASDPDAPRVTVRRVEPARPATAQPTPRHDDDPTLQRPPTYQPSPFLADLAIVDVERASVKRLVEQAVVPGFAFSPDGARVACSILTGSEPNSQQSNFDLALIDLESGTTRTLATNVRLGYGIEWSFSPDGRHLAYIPSGQLARRVVSEGASDERMVLLATADAVITSIRSEHAPALDLGDGEHPPIWDDAGRWLYAVGDGAVWRIDREAGAMRQLADAPGWRIHSIVARARDNTLWTTGERTLWALAREENGARSAIMAIDTSTGESEMVLTEDAIYLGVFNVDAADATGEIAFVSSDLQHLAGLRLFDAHTREARYAPALNPDLDRYELGSSTVIEWLGLDAKPLRGALLLPPGRREGPLPLVVWVYGGSDGSKAVNRFGLAMTEPVFNMHVLATRGYAILYPDIPLSTGRTTQELMSAVMPGVDAAIEQGYADPDQLAIMGQSYGAQNVLSILTRTSRFKAGVITGAVTHPDLFAAYLDASTEYYEAGQGRMGGTIWEFPDRYRENSPLFEFDRIETPLLIGQGDKDGDLVACEAIYRALERLEKPVEYRLYKGDGHVLTNATHVIDFWQRRLEFLAHHLDLRVDENGRVDAD